ncbi:hypothetical protein D9M71_446670 [compost metagenome]
MAAGRPVFEAHLLVAVVEQQRPLAGADDQLFGIVMAELPELHEDRATLGGGRRVMAARRVAHVAADRIGAVLVLEHALQHEEFLAGRMAVLGETAARGIADDGGRPRLFLADAIEHPPLHPRRRTRRPVQPGGMHQRALAQIVVQSHGLQGSARAG